MIWSRTSSSSPLKHALVERAAAELAGAVEQHRPRIGAGEGDAQVGERVAVAAQRHRDAAHRIFDRAADADLVVGRAQARRVPRAHRGDELARPQREIILAVAHASRSPAGPAGRSRYRGSSSGTVRLPCGPARSTSAPSVSKAGARSPLKVAKQTPRLFGATWQMSPVVLRQWLIGGAPPFALVVEDAARVEAEIAADRAHVAMGRARR